jgi:hypothetical protein
MVVLILECGFQVCVLAYSMIEDTRPGVKELKQAESLLK